MDHFHLYTDELGEYSPKRYKKSPLFIVTGCSVEDDNLLRVKHLLDLIKYKFWGSTDIVLHSKNIGKKDKDFTIFRGEIAKFNEFTRDIHNLLHGAQFSIFGVISDQEINFRNGWGSEKVIRETYGAFFRNYIRMLICKKSSGVLVQEASTPFQDIKIYEKFWEYQSGGLPNEKIDHQEVKKKLTSLKFSTKRDSASLTEIADLLGYGLYLDYKIDEGKIQETKMNSYQKMIRKLAKSKLTNISYQNFQAIEVISP